MKNITFTISKAGFDHLTDLINETDNLYVVYRLGKVYKDDGKCDFFSRVVVRNEDGDLFTLTKERDTQWIDVTIPKKLKKEFSGILKNIHDSRVN